MYDLTLNSSALTWLEQKALTIFFAAFIDFVLYILDFVHNRLQVLVLGAIQLLSTRATSVSQAVASRLIAIVRLAEQPHWQCSR